MTSCCVVSSISATRSGVGGGRVAHRLDDVGGHPAGGRVRLQDQRLHPAPELVLVLVAPDPAHLGERVALDHAGTAWTSSARRTTRTSSRRASVIMTAPTARRRCAMLRRASDLTARARERIRAAREHDPHAWPDGDRAGARRTATRAAVGDVDRADPTPVRRPRRAPGTTPARRRRPGHRWAAPSPAPPTSTARSARPASAAPRRAAARTGPGSGAPAPATAAPRRTAAPRTTSRTGCGRRPPGPGG